MVEVFSLVNHSGFSDGLPVIVDEDIAHDGEYPSLEVDVVYIF